MALAFHSDKALWVAFKKGNRDALDTLFRSYYPLLYPYGLKIYANSDFIEESLQDFFLYLYENRSNLSDLERIKPYLFTAYRRRLLRQIKKYRSGRSLSQKDIPWQPDIHFGHDEIMAQQELKSFQKELLVEILHQLPRRQREVIFLRYYSGLEIKEIAEVLSISYQGTVNTLYKAIKTLRQNTSLRRIQAFLSLFIALISAGM